LQRLPGVLEHEGGRVEFRLACPQTSIEDPTVWTRPWTVKQEFTWQSEEANRLYTEPRCVEGNYGHPGLMRGARAEEIAYKEGRGPHPTTKDNATDFVGVEDDPLR
jgi:hypothetical protein